MTMETERKIDKMEFTADNWEFTTQVRAEFNETLAEFLDSTEKVQMLTKSLTVIGLDSGPLLVDEMRKDASIDKDVPNAAIVETASESGSNLAIASCGKGYLLSPMAGSCLVGRLGCSCPAFGKLPLSKKTEWLNTAAQFTKSKKLTAVMRGGKVRGLVTDRYNELSQAKIFDSTIQMLNDNFDSTKFKSGYISHDFSNIDIEIDDDEILSEYKEWMEEVGYQYLENAKIVASVSTSDTADSAVHLSLRIEDDAVSVLLGSPISMAHYKSSSIESWKEEISRISGQVEIMMSALTRLGLIEIQYPDNVFAAVGIEAGLSKKLLSGATVEFHNLTAKLATVTAHDVYYSLSKVLNDNKETMSKENYIRISENLSRCLGEGFPWNDYDTPVVL